MTLPPVVNDTTRDHYATLRRLLMLKPKVVRISTFGMYAGILHDGRNTAEWGPKYQNYTNAFLEALAQSGAKVHILVGCHARKECADGCRSCRDSAKKEVERHLQTITKWPSFEWRFRTDVHMKVHIFDGLEGLHDRVAIVGSRNLSDSAWVDISMYARREQADALTDIFDDEFGRAIPMTRERLSLLAPA